MINCLIYIMKLHMKTKYLIFFLFCFGISKSVNSQNTIVIDSSFDEINLASKVFIFEDKNNIIDVNNIIKEGEFYPSLSNFLNFKITTSTIWLKFDLLNNSSTLNYKLSIDLLNITEVQLFEQKNDSFEKVNNTYGTISKKLSGIEPAITFNLKLNKNKEQTFYLKINNKGQLFIPLFLRSVQKFHDVWLLKFIIFGLYAGIIIALLLYNFFLALSIKDDRKSYLWYLFHTLFILFTQSSYFGYSNLFLWPENYFLSENSFYIFTCLVSISGIEYAKTFLQTKKNSPIIHKLLSFYHLFYLLILTLIFFKEIDIAYNLLQPIQGTIALIMLYTSLKLVIKKSRQALFYFISWSILFISILLFVFTNIGVLPYNLFTSQILLYGSALQVILLSIAQADKYNILKLEEQKAQEKALSIANLNERIIREQNVVLEEKVNLRTVELSNTNIQLNDALISLKDAQMQLIEKEKMSSLGQLTAGIAHEINNPINFVTGNIKPLKRDVLMVIDLLNNFEDVAKSSLTVEEKTAKLKMLKLDLDFDYLNEEINFLLKGIEEGASRTAEIVKGLKIFSRTDEFETKIANVNDGLNSTLVLLNNLISTKIKVIKEFDNENAVIEHFPGKLNQVFMNILSNSIFAINQKWVNETGGVINIKTENIDGRFVISFTDNGIGMSEDVLNRIYEPFYTTKPVGAGTGLGMSIVYKTIELHKGKITIDSKLNQGTTIKIEIPNKLII